MPSKKKTSDQASSQADMAIGVAWYCREEWGRLLAVSVDRERMEETYDEWMRSARRTLLEMKGQGAHVEKVDVGVDELVKWCRDRNVSVNGEARANFASFKLLQRHHRV